MNIEEAKADGLRSWYKELQNYNPDIKPLLIKYIGKDKVESLGDIQKLKEEMRADNISIMGFSIDK